MKDKQWYVDQHRAMWNWIADQIEEERDLRSTSFLKECYLHDVMGLSIDEYPAVNCFACEYCGVRTCEEGCLFNWSEGSKFVRCGKGFFGDCTSTEDWRKQVELARKIANLPVR